MDRKMECPICKKKALFVGVHDDEGNYHGLVGCEYENDPWSGLSYALHHEGWGDCPLCTDGAYSTMGGMLFDTAEDAISALSPPNEPLTLEDAKKERYIWFTPLNDWAKVTPFGVLFFGSEELMNWETLCEEWGYRFKAYRRPPEGEADA